MTQSISNIQTLGTNGNQTFRDMLGIAASVLCAIHCAAMPFVVSFLPLLGLSFLADPSFHKWMVGVCLVLALLAFVPGWRRHNRLQPAIIGVCGLALISFAAFAGPDECCPTPCAASTAPTDTACAAACCDSEETEASAPAAVVLVSDEVDDETSCAASCCAGDETESTAPVAAVLVSDDIVEVDEEAPCAASCCSAE